MLLLTAAAANAQQVSQQEALRKATAFFNKEQLPTIKQKALLAYQATKSAASQTTEDDAYYYIFNRGDNQGFVIVSGDERCYDIQGWSDHGTFDNNKIPCNFKYFLGEYERQIRYVQEYNLQPDVNVTIKGSAKTDIPCLIKTKWDQASPYWDNLVYSNYQCYTGCVATAMAQVMYYWQWPETTTKAIPGYSSTITYLSGSRERTLSYTHSQLPVTNFDWTGMQLLYNAGDDDNGAVAKLMEYAGHAVEMQYGAENTSGSGAYTTDVASALTGYFGYSSQAAYVARSTSSWSSSGLSAAAWQDTIYNNLKDGCPLIMCGSNSEGGHCFVCDGYSTQYTNKTDGSGYYHINWGWSGNSDGYFDLEVMVPGATGSGASGSDGFTSSRGIVKRIHRPDGVIPENDLTNVPLYAASFSVQDENRDVTRRNRREDTTTPIRLFSTVSTVNEGTLTVGYGVYDEAGNLLQTFGTRNRSYSSSGGLINGQVNNFAGELPYGDYKICPVFLDRSTNEWTKISGTDHLYVRATVNADGTSVTFTPSRSVSASVSETKSGGKYQRTLTVTNTGAEAFSGTVYFVCNGYILYEPTIKNLAVGASTTFDVSSYVGTVSSGSLTPDTSNSMSNYIVYVLGSLYLNDALWDNVSDLVSIAGFSSDTDWDYSRVLGDSFNLQVKLANFGRTPSSQTVTVTLFPLNGSSSSISKSQNITLDKHAMDTVDFDFTGLSYGVKYDAQIQYTYGGSSTLDTLSLYGYEIIPTKGILLRRADTYSILSDADASSWSAVPDDVWFVDARHSAKAANIRPGSNPNTLYLLADGASVPGSLSGKNVVIGTAAENLDIEDGYDFYTPIDFTAETASYKRTFTKGNDGEQGNWETLLLPFDVNTVKTSEGSVLSWFNSLTERGKNFWIYRFGSEDDNNTVIFDYPTSSTTLASETPYIISVPAQSSKWGSRWVLVGKEMVFSGSHVSVKASEKFATGMSADKKFDFIGRTYATSRNMIYDLNETGSKFINTSLSWADIDPFRCYFVGYFNNNGQTMKMHITSNDDTPTGIGFIEGDVPTGTAPSIYTLDGKKVQTDENLPGGVYIVNGKKVVK